MAGLSLGFRATAAAPPRASGAQTITQQYYGVGSGADAGMTSSKAGPGTMVVGAIAAGVLAWIWWTLPR